MTPRRHRATPAADLPVERAVRLLLHPRRRPVRRLRRERHGRRAIALAVGPVARDAVGNGDPLALLDGLRAGGGRVLPRPLRRRRPPPSLAPGWAPPPQRAHPPRRRPRPPPPARGCGRRPHDGDARPGRDERAHRPTHRGAHQWPPVPPAPSVSTLKTSGRSAPATSRAPSAPFSIARTMLWSTIKNRPGTCTVISTMAAPPAGISVVCTFRAGVPPIAASVYTV